MTATIANIDKPVGLERVPSIEQLRSRGLVRRNSSQFDGPVTPRRSAGYSAEHNKEVLVTPRGLVSRTSNQFGGQVTPRRSAYDSGDHNKEILVTPELAISAQPAIDSTANKICTAPYQKHESVDTLRSRGLVSRRLSGADDQNGECANIEQQIECEFFSISEDIMCTKANAAVDEKCQRQSSIQNLLACGLVTQKLSVNGFQQREFKEQQIGPTFPVLGDDSYEQAPYKKRAAAPLSPVMAMPSNNDSFRCFTECVLGLEKCKAHFRKGR